MRPLSREALLARIRQLLEQPSGSAENKSIGAELEMLPFHRTTGKRVPAQGDSPSGSEFLRVIAQEFGWSEKSCDPDPSSWNFPDGLVSFEPGGQIELSSAVFPTASGLLTAMRHWGALLTERAADFGIELRAIGIDDVSSIRDVPLQLTRRRYSEMTRYFNQTGPFGILMMRQTASLQINVERGPNPLERWHLLNALAPYLLAIFANSPCFERSDTGHKSYRAHTWRTLDPRRTGIAWEEQDPVLKYLNFALDAPVLLERRGKRYPAFSELLEDNSATEEIWETHLTTLFPEIRPREYFEIRSLDAIEPADVAAAIAFVCGIVYSGASSRAALAVMGNPESSLLTRAGRLGLGDKKIQSVALPLVELALEGCRDLGTSYISKLDISAAETFFRNYTFQNRSPADDRLPCPQQPHP